MAGAVGIVFGLCVLSFTLGAALMYVVLRRREDAAPHQEPAAAELDERTWVEKPAVEPVADDYDSRPIHRNPVVGLPQLEPALASLVEPLVEAEPEPEPNTDARTEVEAEADEPVEPVGEVEPVEETEEAGSPDVVEVVEAVEEAEEPVEPEPVELEPVEEAAVTAALPPPAAPQPEEHTTWMEREDFRARYLRTFEEVRRKAGSN